MRCLSRFTRRRTPSHLCIRFHSRRWLEVSCSSGELSPICCVDFIGPDYVPAATSPVTAALTGNVDYFRVIVIRAQSREAPLVVCGGSRFCESPTARLGARASLACLRKRSAAAILVACLVETLFMVEETWQSSRRVLAHQLLSRNADYVSLAA